MPRRRRTTEVTVGIFVLASILLLVIFVVIIGKRQNIFERRYNISAFFNNVGGLQTGADVLLSGINVGFVRAIKFGATNRVEVDMSIKLDEQQRIRNDSVATIRTMGMMGDKYVAITVGSSSEPEIQPGGTIKAQEMFELSDLIEQARPAINDLEVSLKNVADITGRLANPSGDVATILDNVKTMTTDAREGKGTLGALLTRDELYTKANGVLDNLGVVSDNAKKASANLPDILADAKVSVQRFDEFSVKASKVADGMSQMVDTGKDVMQKANVIATNIESASKDIKQATPRLNTILESADKDVSEARQVIEAAKNSWLLRGYFKPPAPSAPIAAEGRDTAKPEVKK